MVPTKRSAIIDLFGGLPKVYNYAWNAMALGMHAYVFYGDK